MPFLQDFWKNYRILQAAIKKIEDEIIENYTNHAIKRNRRNGNISPKGKEIQWSLVIVNLGMFTICDSIL